MFYVRKTLTRLIALVMTPGRNEDSIGDGARAPGKVIMPLTHSNEMKGWMPVDAERLHAAAALLMACLSNWNAPDRDKRLSLAIDDNRSIWKDLQSALACDDISLPIEARQNLLILSVYAEGRLSELSEHQSQDLLGPLIALTRNLAVSLKDWRAAA
jgi:flagellar biosynthesis regulator FlaF